jgi:hypothetical protein
MVQVRLEPIAKTVKYQMKAILDLFITSLLPFEMMGKREEFFSAFAFISKPSSDTSDINFDLDDIMSTNRAQMNEQGWLQNSCYSVATYPVNTSIRKNGCEKSRQR